MVNEKKTINEAKLFATGSYSTNTRESDFPWKNHGRPLVCENDSDAEVPARSHDYKIPTDRQDNEHVSARVKSTHALCESLRLIMEIPEMCDVTFLVGPREIPVHGVRAILGTEASTLTLTRASQISSKQFQIMFSSIFRVLYQLIIKHLNLRETGLKYTIQPSLRHYGDRLIIPVRKYDAEVFRMLIQFVHSGTATITDSTVFGLLCGADQFELKDLEQACWEYMDRRIECDCGDVCRLQGPTKNHRKAHEIFNTIYCTIERQNPVSASSSSRNLYA
ncbi:serine-enriched protein-like [Mercenaria mercenaria]|uniref:serine-enriched protein-like n=1 Tax=Mercenaria mercenaria TaxID=6596 RepID=UPI001E1D2682|nr:serine-enriched protein-like [Mercenaria mercenaria]